MRNSKDYLAPLKVAKWSFKDSRDSQLTHLFSQHVRSHKNSAYFQFIFGMFQGSSSSRRPTNPFSNDWNTTHWWARIQIIKNEMISSSFFKIANFSCFKLKSGLLFWYIFKRAIFIHCCLFKLIKLATLPLLLCLIKLALLARGELQILVKWQWRQKYAYYHCSYCSGSPPRGYQKVVTRDQNNDWKHEHVRRNSQ